MHKSFFRCKISKKFAYMQKKVYFCSVKTKFYILILLCCTAMPIFSETKWDYKIWRNEIRIGWGDQLFESLIWHNPTNITTSMPESYQQTYHEDYRHHQHLWVEYQYRFNHWFSLGGMIDISEVGWDDVTRNGKGMEINRDKNHYFYNAVLMPTVRFTYFFHPNVNLYSGLGIGMDINGGTEQNAEGHKTDVGAAVNLTVFGVSANYKQWFWTVDFGGMYALRNKNTIFMASSRIINVGLGARF